MLFLIGIRRHPSNLAQEKKRVGKTHPIRRVISSKDVKLSSNFNSFLSLSANKADLASFFARAVIEMAEELQPTNELVIAGGFDDLMWVWTSTGRNTESLSTNHEEADTRIILHARDASLQGYQRCVSFNAEIQMSWFWP